MDGIPFDKGKFLLYQMKQVFHSMEAPNREPTANGRGPGERGVRWEHPEPEWHVLNTDGASKGVSGRAGAGGVVRGDHGEWIVGFSEQLGVCSAIQAELRAVLRGLRIAREMGLRKLWIQVDSMVVVTLLSTSDLRFSAYHGILQQCKILLAWGYWETRVTHCFREANQVADKLANLGIEGNLGVTMYPTPPREVREALFSDRMGVVWPRQLQS